MLQYFLWLFLGVYILCYNIFLCFFLAFLYFVAILFLWLFLAFSISGPCGFKLCPEASKGSTTSGFGFKGPQLKVKSDSLLDIEPGIKLGTLGTRRVTYQLHHASS